MLVEAWARLSELELMADSLIAVLQIAGGDPLRDEGFAYEEALKADGVDVETHVFPGLPHYFHIFPFPSSKAFYDNIVKFVKENAA